jgi:hypothetical protein
MNIVLHLLAAGCNLNASCANDSVSVPIAKAVNSLPEFRLRLHYVRVNPKLSSRSGSFGRIEQVCEDLLVGAEYVVGKPQAMNKRD